MRGRGGQLTVSLQPIEAPPALRARVPGLREGTYVRLSVIDTGEHLLATTQRALQGLGYRIVTATRGDDALALFHEAPGHFDLVLTDQAMPGIDGETLTEELLRLRPELPVIIWTGFSDRLDEERARQLGARALLMKPVESRRLAKLLHELLTRGE